MKCDICSREFSFLYFIGKNNVCNKCVAKHTVFKEVRHSEDALLRRAIRAFEVKDFEDLKKITNYQLDELEMGNVQDKKKKTFKYKKNKASAVKVDSGDYLDPQTELDLGL